ncbi:2-phospho-L-lactate guanylyltransferase [Williamsia sp. MIQD14]|uniref:2-phospho-L-lactate guanylyltransferase n=1 Tax=Williamsia sp. MIQD14 TaxID=3425703 RepID=UPI003DA1B9FA
MQDQRSTTRPDPLGATADAGGDGRGLAAVLAVKDLTDAKSRLSPVLSATARRDLVLAMLADTVAAARAAGVGDVVVVTPDATVAEAATALGARTVDDGVGSPAADDGGPLNRAFARGIAAASDRSPGTRVIVLQADLPTVRVDHLREALAMSVHHHRSFVPDRSGSGTAMLILSDTADVTTRFGLDSAASHRAAGAVDLTDGAPDRWPDLRADVDTVDDLHVARALGVGAATARVLDGGSLSSLGATPTPHAS